MSLPNQLTILRIVLTPIFVVLLFLEGIYFKYASFFVFLFASLTDWYDGYIARKFGYVTKWGKFLDPLADKVLISSALISFTIIGYVKPWMVIIIVFRDFLITGLRSYALFKKQPIVTSNLARYKTVSQMLAIYFILLYMLYNESLSSHGKQSMLLEQLNRVNFIEKMMLFVTFLTAATGVFYLIENRKHIKGIVIDFYRVFIPTDLGS